jgi:hypothetical protein
MHRIAWPDQPAMDPFPYGTTLDMNNDHHAIFMRHEDGKILWTLARVVPEKNSVVMTSHGVAIDKLRKPTIHSVSLDDWGTVILFYQEKSDSQNSYYLIGQLQPDRQIHWNKPQLFNDYSMSGAIRTPSRASVVVAVWSEHMTAMSNINAQVGEIDRANLTINWGEASRVEGGGIPTLGINNSKNLVQIHETDRIFSNQWYCRGGIVDPQSHQISWRESEKIGKDANFYTFHPVSLLDSGLILEMHAQSNLGPTIWYRFGTSLIDGQVRWETENWLDGGPGGFVTFACSDAGTVLTNRGSRMPFNPDSLWIGRIVQA